MRQIRPGDRVRALTANGEWIEQRAASPMQRGDDFPVVLVCDEAEWRAAQAEDRRPEALPWPAESVEKLEAPIEAVHGAP